MRKGFDALTLGLNLYSIYEEGATVAYYYYFAGETVGQTAVDSLIIVNYYMNWFELRSIPQYERYNPNNR